MTQAAVAKMRFQMLKETEGFLSHKLTIQTRKQIVAQPAIVEYFRRFALRCGTELTIDSIAQISI